MLIRSVFGYQFHKDLTMESWPYMRSWSGAYCDLILHNHRFTEADMEFPYESANLEYIYSLQCPSPSKVMYGSKLMIDANSIRVIFIETYLLAMDVYKRKDSN